MELLMLALLGTIAVNLPCVTPAHIEPILSQSQAAGDSGQYAYSYKSGLESKSETRTPDGRTQGSYSYIDSDGKVQLVKYTAGVDGFHAETSHLPIEGARHIPEIHAPASHHFLHAGQPDGVLGDTPEVAAARMQHLAAHAAALAVLPKLREEAAPVHVGPTVFGHFDHSGVLGDTPEVEAARRQHAAAHAAARKNLPVVPQESFAHVHHNPVFPVSHNHLLRNDQGIPKFAEDVPRSALGETPEVAAAREAHLAFYSKVKAGLPEDNSGRLFHH